MTTPKLPDAPTGSAYDAPMQPLYRDEHGIVRFRANKIVRYVFDNARTLLRHSNRDPSNGIDLNRLFVLESMNFPQEDWEQFYQLIGYSLAGYHELSLVSNQSASEASARAELAGFSGHGGCRDSGCPVHTHDEEP